MADGGTGGWPGYLQTTSFIPPLLGGEQLIQIWATEKGLPWEASAALILLGAPMFFAPAIWKHLHGDAGTDLPSPAAPDLRTAPKPVPQPSPQRGQRPAFDPIKQAFDEHRLAEYRAILKGRLSDLKLTVGETGKFFKTKSTDGTIRRTYCVKCENVSRDESVRNCKVTLNSITTQTEYIGPWVIEEGFDLAAGDHKFIPLISYGEARLPSAIGETFMEVLPPGVGNPKPSSNNAHILQIRATGISTGPYDFCCKVWIEGGQLRIAQAENTTGLDTESETPTGIATSSSLIPLIKAAEEAYAALEGTPFGDEIVGAAGFARGFGSISKTTEEILRLVMLNMSKCGEVTGLKWPSGKRLPVGNMNEFKIYPDENCLRYDDGDRPIYTELATTRAVIDEFVRYGNSVSGQL